MNHEKRRLVERVGYITSPGFLDGGGSREKAGLVRGGPAAVITDRAILRPLGNSRELHLTSVHPGHSVEEIREHTGWALKTAPRVDETPPPSPAELDALHRVDHEGHWR